MYKRQHEIEVRSISGSAQSLPSFASFIGSGGEESSFAVPPIVIGLVGLVFLAWCASLLLVRLRSDIEIDGMISNLGASKSQVIDAEIVTNGDD